MELVNEQFLQKKLERAKTSLRNKGLFADEQSFEMADPDVEWLVFMLDGIMRGNIAITHGNRIDGGTK